MCCFNHHIYLNNLESQIKEAYGRVIYTYTSHLKYIAILKNKYNILEWLEIIFSALSATGFLALLQWNTTWIKIAGGLLTTMLLVVCLINKTFNISNSIQQHRIAADKLWNIKESYISLLTDFPILSTEEIAKRRDSLQEKTFNIYENTPKTNDKSYAEAQKALKNNEEQFFSDAELNQMLPIHLRKTL